LRRAHKPDGPSARLYRRLDFGGLARLHVVDDRQYWDYQVCPKSGLGGGGNTVGPECADRTRPERTLLGGEQERWLEQGLTAAGARWNILAQQTLVAPCR